MENSISVSRHAVSLPEKERRNINILNLSAASWVVVAVIGQWIFAIYLALFYAGNALIGNIEAWNSRGPHGIVEGDPIGNTAMAIHVLVAMVIMVGGPLQLVPRMRRSFPKFHRLNGKVYLATATLVSMAGVYMIWTRGSVGGMVLYVANTLDAALIVLFGIMAWRTAVAKKFNIHRKWTLRLFMVVSAVWFYRIGLMFWLGVNGGPVGIDFETFTGPFLTFLAFAQYLLPLAILELYFFAQARAGAFGKTVTALVILLGTGVTAIGVFMATMGLWLPHM